MTKTSTHFDYFENGNGQNKIEIMEWAKQGALAAMDITLETTKKINQLNSCTKLEILHLYSQIKKHVITFSKMIMVTNKMSSKLLFFLLTKETIYSL